MSGSIRIDEEFGSDATVSSAEFGGTPGDALTISTSVAATSSPTGAFTLETYNTALGAWAEVADATSALSAGDPAAGAAAAVSAFINPPLGRLRVTYTAGSGGSATVGSLSISIERGRRGN